MRRIVALCLSLAIAVVAAACGSTDETAAPAPAPSTAAAEPAATTAAAEPAPSAEPIKAAWIYVGPHDDHGWSQAHDEGRLHVQEQMGDAVVTTFKENVPEGPQVAQVIEDLIKDGNRIIFATSFGFQDAMAEAAAKHPDVYFEHATGFKTSENMAQFFGAGEDAIFLSGMAAGAATKNGTIGYVAPFAIPEVIRHANAFYLGAKTVNPKATMKVIWTNSWFDPEKESKAAESLIAAGADTLGQNVDSPATGQVAEKQGIPWVGYDSDASEFAPNQWLTAAVYNWGPYYLTRVQAAADGSWQTGNYYGDFKDDFVGIARFGPGVSAETQAAIAEKLAGFKDGTFDEFTGPIADQAGEVRIADAATPTMEELLAMDWFVQGIEGDPKGG